MNPTRTAAWLALASVALAGVALRPTATAAPERFVFAAVGCVPYGRGGDAEAAFGRLIAEINRHDPAFTVHLGDILGSNEHPTDELLRRRVAQFNSFASALIYTPGDNEWTDSRDAAEGSFDPLERLSRVRAMFFATERSLGQKPIPLDTQRRDPTFAKFVENARWTWQGIMFATVHVVGSANNNQPAVPGAVAEFAERDRADEAWIHGTFAAARSANAPGLALFFQADPFAADHGAKGYGRGFERLLRALEEESIAFKRPVLLVHADEHRYRLDFGMRFRADAAAVPNVTRIETFGDFAVHGIIVVVDPRSPEIFLPGPLLVPGNRLPVVGRQNNQLNSMPP